MQVIHNRRLSKKNDIAFLLINLFSSVFSLAVLTSSSVSALTYGSSFGLKYDVNSTLDVSLSTNTGFIISDLSAGNSAYSNTVTITVDSNASDGYTLSATVGKTSDNNRNNNRLVHSNNTNYFEGIATDANVTLANLGPNKWGYATYDTTNEIWSNYNGLATVGNAGTTLITSTTPGTKSIDMRIGASANSNQVSGTFTNDINFAATARVVTYDYSITYNANNSSTVTNMPSNVSNASFNTGSSVQLSSDTPSATNAISFLGWCDGTVSGTTCTGTLYQPGDYLKFANASSSTTNAVSLTGVWELDKIYMQDMTLSDCQVNVGTGGNATNIGDNITVYDKRSSNYPSGDDGDYTARWINGACWMTQNLRIQGTISATDSNFSSGSINVSQYDLKTNGSNECGSTDGYNNPCSRVPDSTDMSTIGSGVTAKEVGAWYNYYATTAGTISTNSNSTVASSDICPSGWHLPTGAANNTSSEFYKLFQSTSTSWITNDYLTAFGAVKGGGYVTGSLLGGSAAYGYWWSATVFNTTNRYNLRYDSSNGQFYSGGGGRYSGNFVRCVKDSDGYMQDFALASADDGIEYTLVDKRDNNTYTVKKINGQLWMTQNLRYLGDTGSAAKTMTIGNNNSNVANKSITLYSLNSSNAGSFNAYSSHCDDTNGYNYACVYDSGNTSTGVWYNYYAASACTISTNSNSTAATSDICPAGWHLPSGPNTTANTDYNKLVGNTTSGYHQNPTAGLTAFSAVAGGLYYNGSLINTGYGVWWSATANDTALRYSLGYNSSNGQFNGNNSVNRFVGFFVRCVKE